MNFLVTASHLHLKFHLNFKLPSFERTTLLSAHIVTFTTDSNCLAKKIIQIPEHKQRPK